MSSTSSTFAISRASRDAAAAPAPGGLAPVAAPPLGSLVTLAVPPPPLGGLATPPAAAPPGGIANPPVAAPAAAGATPSLSPRRSSTGSIALAAPSRAPRSGRDNGFIASTADAPSFSFFAFLPRASDCGRCTEYAITFASLPRNPSDMPPCIIPLRWRGPEMSSGARTTLDGSSTPPSSRTSNTSTSRPSTSARLGRDGTPKIARYTSRPMSVAKESFPAGGAGSAAGFEAGFASAPFLSALFLPSTASLAGGASGFALAALSLESSERIFCSSAKSRPLTRCVCSMSPPRYLLCAIDTRCCCACRSSRSPSCANVGALEMAGGGSSSTSIRLSAHSTGSGASPPRCRFSSSLRRSAARSVYFEACASASSRRF
mmetsp:Transcript_20574/g.47131  ORF Transcript_20574/g.47131 Transcript_20574/m.47131 type:complete len:375 (-) Transcript_20574:192-1316(-)